MLSDERNRYAFTARQQYRPPVADEERIRIGTAVFQLTGNMLPMGEPFPSALKLIRIALEAAVSVHIKQRAQSTLYLPEPIFTRLGSPHATARIAEYMRPDQGAIVDKAGHQHDLVFTSPPIPSL